MECVTDIYYLHSNTSSAKFYSKNFLLFALSSSSVGIHIPRSSAFTQRAEESFSGIQPVRLLNRKQDPDDGSALRQLLRPFGQPRSAVLTHQHQLTFRQRNGAPNCRDIHAQLRSEDRGGVGVTDGGFKDTNSGPLLCLFEGNHFVSDLTVEVLEHVEGERVKDFHRFCLSATIAVRYASHFYRSVVNHSILTRFVNRYHHLFSIKSLYCNESCGTIDK